MNLRLIQILVLCVMLIPAIASAQDKVNAKLNRDDDSKLIDGLRRRRLFDLAELYCQNRLAKLGNDPTSQAHLTVELLKTQTSNAILSPAGQRAVAWQAIDATTNSFLQNNSDHPRRILVEVQLALSHLTHGKLIGQEIAAEMADESASGNALNEIRTARKMLQKLENDIDLAIPNLRGRATNEHDLTVEQLLTLKNNLRYQLAICNLNRSQLYAKQDFINRADALNDVKGRLNEVQRATSAGQPLWWKTKLGQIECFRLLGDTGEAKSLVDSLPKEEIPASTKTLLLEQKIYLAIEMGNEPLVKEVISEFSSTSPTTPQLELALIELAIDLSARADSDAKKKQWLDFASQATRAIEVNHGGYWGRRADLAMIRAAGGLSGVANDGGNTTMNDPKTGQSNLQPDSVTNTELDQLIRIGENAFRKNNLDDAIKAYEQASVKARSLGDRDQALRLDMTIGQILEKQSKRRGAAEHFINAARKDVNAANASAAHLRGCWNLAQTFKDDQTEEAQLASKKLFEEQLTAHLKTWPQNPSANLARIYLADQHRQQKEWQAAFETYLGVADDSSHLPAALKGLNWSAKQWIEATDKSKQSVPAVVRFLTSSLAKKHATMQSKDPASMQLELLIAELDLVYGSGTASNLVQRMEVIEASDEVTIASSAKAIRAALTCDTNAESSRQLVVQIANDSDALALCDRVLKSLADKGSSDNAKKIRLLAINSRLKLAATKNDTPPSNLLSSKSEVLGELGRYSEAITVLNDLEKRFPRNAGIKMQLARAMTAQYRSSDPAKPLDRWRRLLGQLKSHTPNWYEAKYNVASLLIASGKKSEAATLLKLLKQVGQGWEKSSLKPEFEELLIKAEK